MRDKIMVGAISGMTGSLAQLIFGLFSKKIGFTDRSFIDFSIVFFMYKRYQGILAYMIGLIVHFTIGAFLGIAFAYLMERISKKYYYFKGVGFGIAFWLVFGVSGTVLHLPIFKAIPPKPALSTLIGAILFGLFTAYTLRFLERKTHI